MAGSNVMMEKLSAALDGECSREELAELMIEVGRSPELSARWSRMCAVRDARAGLGFATPRADFCAGVMAKLGVQDESAASPKVVPIRAARPANDTVMPRTASRARFHLRPAVGFAAAASLATVALFAGHAFLGSSPQAANSPQVAALEPVQPSAFVPVSTGDGSSASGGRAHAMQVVARTPSANDSGEPRELGWSQLDPATAQELNSYMSEHDNYRADRGLGALNAGRLAAQTQTVSYRPGSEAR